MSVNLLLHDGSAFLVPEATDGRPGEVEGLLVALAGAVPARLRRGHGLKKSASQLALLAKVGGLDEGALDPLGKTSTGIYTEDDYLAQFSEDWEHEEYGRFAAETVAKNEAAWHPMSAYRAAIDAAIRALTTPEVTAVLAIEPAPAEARAVLSRLISRLAAAPEAARICVEIDDLD